jgi:hypothetical protein
MARVGPPFRDRARTSLGVGHGSRRPLLNVGNYYSAITAVLSSLSCRAPLRVIPGSVLLFRKRFNSLPRSRPTEHGISTKASL